MQEENRKIPNLDDLAREIKDSPKKDEEPIDPEITHLVSEIGSKGKRAVNDLEAAIDLLEIAEKTDLAVGSRISETEESEADCVDALMASLELAEAVRGLEGYRPDLRAKKCLRESMSPAFFATKIDPLASVYPDLAAAGIEQKPEVFMRRFFDRNWKPGGRREYTLLNLLSTMADDLQKQAGKTGEKHLLTDPRLSEEGFIVLAGFLRQQRLVELEARKQGSERSHLGATDETLARIGTWTKEEVAEETGKHKGYVGRSGLSTGERLKEARRQRLVLRMLNSFMYEAAVVLTDNDDARFEPAKEMIKAMKEGEKGSFSETLRLRILLEDCGGRGSVVGWIRGLRRMAEEGEDEWSQEFAGQMDAWVKEMPKFRIFESRELEKLTADEGEENKAETAVRIIQLQNRLRVAGIEDLDVNLDKPEEIAETGFSSEVYGIQVVTLTRKPSIFMGAFYSQKPGEEALKTIFAVDTGKDGFPLFVDVLDRDKVSPKTEKALLRIVREALRKRISIEEAKKAEEAGEKPRGEEAGEEERLMTVVPAGPEKGPEQMAPAGHKRRAQAFSLDSRGDGEAGSTAGAVGIAEQLEFAGRPAFVLVIPEGAWEGFSKEEIRLFQQAIEQYGRGGKSLTTIQETKDLADGPYLRLRAGGFRLIFKIDREAKGRAILIDTIDRKNLRSYLKKLK